MLFKITRAVDEGSVDANDMDNEEEEGEKEGEMDDEDTSFTTWV